MKIKWILMTIIALGVSACEGEGGTETGSTFGTKIEAAADTLVPNITAPTDSSENASMSRKAIDGTSDAWSTYTSADNVIYLDDIFGDPESGFSVVTKLRVLVNQAARSINDISSGDPDFDCTGTTAVDLGDSPEIAFYGTIANGTADDRYYTCLVDEEVYVVLYGQDEAGTLRFVLMQDMTSTNTEQPETRGDEVTIKSVTQVVYHETTSDDDSIAYLDLQFAHATIYSGIDNDTEASDDNVLFKSRSRITGMVTLDDNGDPTAGSGDFTVTKYDQSPMPDNTPVVYVTKSIGRGNYGAGEYSLFKIESSAGTLSEVPGTFCLQIPTDGTLIPVYADAANCTSLETSTAWISSSFPFTLLPTIEENFESNLFYEDNDTDMVSNTGDNFTIPTY